jgi:hypothetical protein
VWACWGWSWWAGGVVKAMAGEPEVVVAAGSDERSSVQRANTDT